MNCQQCTVNLAFASANLDIFKVTTQPAEHYEPSGGKAQTHGCSYSLGWAATTIVFVAFTIVGGFYIGMRVDSFQNSRAAVRWQSLGSPPEKVVKIVAADVYSVYVQTAGGKTYSCETWTYTSKCWVESEPPKRIERSGPCYTITPAIPAPPGKVIDRMETFICGEVSAEARYALTEEGKVWKWKYEWGGLSLGLGYGTLTGVLVGFLIGIGILVFLWRISQ